MLRLKAPDSEAAPHDIVKPSPPLDAPGSLSHRPPGASFSPRPEFHSLLPHHSLSLWIQT